jgi:hypothetical protein
MQVTDFVQFASTWKIFQRYAFFKYEIYIFIPGIGLRSSRLALSSWISKNVLLVLNENLFSVRLLSETLTIKIHTQLPSWFFMGMKCGTMLLGRDKNYI